MQEQSLLQKFDAKVVELQAHTSNHYSYIAAIRKLIEEHEQEIKRKNQAFKIR